jgi:tetratricopeptide (TPR) repeat protein
MTSITRPTRRPRALGLLTAATLIIAGTYAASVLRPAAPQVQPPVVREPAAPARPSTLDAGGAPDGSLAQIDHSIAAWSKNLDANPQDFLSATNLAALYQGRGRLTYDLTDYQQAQAAAETALAIEPTHAPARAIRASILLSLHDFTGAFDAADALVRDDSSEVGALGTRFDAEVELGRIDDARADLERLRPFGGPGVLIREARLVSATGDPATALQRAREAQTSAVEDEVDDLGFYAYAVGEYARSAGDGAAARTSFEDALRIRNGDLGSLVGLARIDAFDGRVDAAIADLQRATAIAPQPEALGLLGDMLTQAGQAGADKAFDTVRFIERLQDIQTTTYDRQLIRFELDHGGATDDVLARARASTQARPDWTGYDTLAWALYRLGRFEEASTAMDSAHALGADNARLRFHDGAIKLASVDPAGGRALLRSALELGPALDPIERAEALRLLGR